MDHISGNKIRPGSIEVPIDREYPDENPVKASQIAIHFNGRGWPSKWENAKKEALKGPDKWDRMCHRAQNFIARPHHESI